MAIDESWTRDWTTIWQSELSALATDREMHEGWVRAWANASALKAAPGCAVDGPAGCAAPDAPARAAAPGDALAALERRVAELERLLAERA